MQNVTQDIPESPRDVLWRTAFRARWIAGILGAALALICVPLVIVVLAAGGDILPLHDDALDNKASTVPAQVTGTSESNVRDSRGSYQRVKYAFLDQSGASHHSSSLMHPEDIPEQLRVEYLPSNPEISRIKGTRRRTAAMTLDLVFGLVVLPGILCLLFWLRGVLALKHLYGTGIPGIATVTDMKALFGISPPQLRVQYEFLTQTGERVKGKHLVGQRSDLGKALSQGDRCAVLYDEAKPETNRLVTPSAFQHRSLQN